MLGEDRDSVLPAMSSEFYFSDRLWRKLAAIREKPLTVIEAPMGYGKTVAAREYPRHHDIQTLWTPVLGGGPDIFWRDFCRSLGRAFPHAEETVDSLRRLAYPRDAVYADAARELILNLDFQADTVFTIPGRGRSVQIDDTNSARFKTITSVVNAQRTMLFRRELA